MEPEAELTDTLTTAFEAIESRMPDQRLPESDRGQLASADMRYRLQPEDRFSVFFPAFPGENFEGLVRPDGYVTSPRYGDVMAMGLSSAALADSLRALYSRDFRHIRPNVSLTETGEQYLYVYGAVGSPDRYGWDGSIDLLSALTLAGGPTSAGKIGSIIVVRVGYSGLYTYQVFDLRQALAGGGEPVWLQPRDIVIVPTRLISDIRQFIDDYIMTFIPPIDAFVRTRYYWRLGNDILTNP